MTNSGWHAGAFAVLCPWLRERPNNPGGGLFPDSLGHLREVGGRIDFIISLGRNLLDGGIGSDDDENDLRRMLLEKPREASDGLLRGRRRNGFDEEQDGAAMGDDRGRVFREPAGRIPDPEVEGTVSMRDALSSHLIADGRFELRP